MMNAIYVNRSGPDSSIAAELRERLSKRGAALTDKPVYFEQDLPLVAEQVMQIHRARTLSSGHAGALPS